MKNENKPYLWWPAGNYPEKGYLRYNWKEQETDDLIFMQGHPVPDQNYDLVVQCGLEEKHLTNFDLLPGHIVGPVVNQRTIDILSTICPKDFQAFPITIINDPKIAVYENRDYFLINVTREVDSVDRENSYLDLEEDGLGIDNIRKLIFKTGCMENVHLAREKYFHPLVIVSPPLVKAFNKEKIKGARFLEGQEVYDRLFPEEYLVGIFPEDSEAAKRYFVSKLNDKEEYAFFKTRIPKIPQYILEALIEMTVSRSSFHKEQCEEIRELLKERK